MDSSEKYKRLIESLEYEYFFYSHTIDGRYLYISPSIEKVLGYTVEEASDGLVKYMTDGEINRDTIGILKKSAKGERQKTFEFELFTKNEGIKVIEITESPLYDKSGKLVSIEGVAHDITRRKNREQIIKEQNEKLREQKRELQETLQNLKETEAQLIQSEKIRALDHLIFGIAHEINTPIGAINASIENITTSMDSSIKSVFLLMKNDFKDELDVFMQIMIMTEKERPVLKSKQKRKIKKEIIDKLKKTEIKNIQSVADYIMFLNIYQQVDDIIPLLQKTNTEYALKAARDIYSVIKNAENIKLAVEKASNVILALKHYIHKDQLGIKEKTDLIKNIETVLTLLNSQLQSGIKVIYNFNEIPLIDCYPDQLIQVWVNLIMNAIQAMNGSGTLTISIKQVKSKIEVVISDTGHGIPMENRRKIFDPFFTTKKIGEGTGIGLDIVKKIIDKHNATIDFESEEGKGTTFFVSLPLH